MKMKFGRYPCKVVFARYVKNGNTAIRLVADAPNGECGLMDEEPIATATVNGGNKLDPGLVAIKNYSENTGMDDALIRAGVIESEVVHSDPCFGDFPIYRLTKASLALVSALPAGSGVSA